ncbi:predicted protein [Coccidioides posadasii str. Silveira]|uniref:Predicted protein n=1 Tax=Coccidioides posadasii (strain RMSCC 757 / Silveira) TaxID=443226 RepID=E9CT74_COCPS|nr:predicted protein [Coccidioides posadasii str. Silveira]
MMTSRDWKQEPPFPEGARWCHRIDLNVRECMSFGGKKGISTEIHSLHIYIPLRSGPLVFKGYHHRLRTGYSHGLLDYLLIALEGALATRAFQVTSKVVPTTKCADT